MKHNDFARALLAAVARVTVPDRVVDVLTVLDSAGAVFQGRPGAFMRDVTQDIARLISEAMRHTDPKEGSELEQAARQLVGDINEMGEPGRNVFGGFSNFDHGDESEPGDPIVMVEWPNLRISTDRLMHAVADATQVRAVAATIAPSGPSGTYRCANCNSVIAEHELRDVKHLSQRLEAGDTVPDGECPHCGAFAYAVAPSVPNPTQPNPVTLTERDWAEIYYALDGKRSQIAQGEYGSDDDEHGDVNVGEWRGHLDAILGTIGADGRTAAERGATAG